MHIQQLLINRLRIGTGTAKCPSETLLHSNTELTRSTPDTAPAFISFEERKFALVLFITLAALHLSNSCHILSQGELLEGAAESRDAQRNRRQSCLQIPVTPSTAVEFHRHESEQSPGHAALNYP